MNEKTTVYIEEELKKEVQIKLIRDYENKSLSALINDLLNEWNEKDKRKAT